MVCIVLDILVVVILLLFALHGAQRGLILSLCGLLAVVIAFAGAGWAAKQFSPALAEQLEPRIATVVEGYLTADAQSSADPSVQSSAEPSAALSAPPADGEDADPADTLDILRNMGFSANLSASLEDAARQGMSSATTSATGALSAAIAPSISYLAAFLIAFVILLAILTLLFRALNMVAKLPVLRFFNRTGGLVLGLAKACILLFLIGWLLQYLGGILPEETVQATHLLKFFSENTPVSLLQAWQNKP